MREALSQHPLSMAQNDVVPVEIRFLLLRLLVEISLRITWEFLLFGAVEPRKVQEACRFSGLDPNTTVMSVSERHFSKKLLALWMASYVKQKAVVLARYYRQHGDVAHKVVEKHVPLRSEL